MKWLTKLFKRANVMEQEYIIVLEAIAEKHGSSTLPVGTISEPYPDSLKSQVDRFENESPNFLPKETEELAARNYERVNRWKQ